MVAKMELTLCLETKQQRQAVRLRLDGGFGTDDNINFALWRGYGVLAKMFSGKRARKLAQSVQEWVDVPSATLDGPRQAGWVKTTKRYCRKTRQLAIRKPNPKKKDGYSYAVIVTTDIEGELQQIRGRRCAVVRAIAPRHRLRCSQRYSRKLLLSRQPRLGTTKAAKT